MLVGESYFEAEGIGTVKLCWQENVKNLQCTFFFRIESN